MKDKKLLFSILLAFVFLLSVGLTYAYFTVTVNIEGEPNDILTSTGTLSLVYNSGPEISVPEIYPGWTTTKTFTVTNTGSLDTSYSINWEEINNTIINNELVMSLSCTGEDCRTLAQKPVGNMVGPFIDDINIAPGVTHTYTLTLSFIETSTLQNYNQGKVFGGKITIKESTGIFDLYGTLVNASNAPIQFATVTLHSTPRTTVTDSNGNFMFENVEPDNHTLSVEVEGEEVIDDELTIINGATSEIKDTTITKKQNAKQLNIKIKASADKSIASLEEIHYTLSSRWATTLNIAKPNIRIIAVEKTLESPATYTYNGVTYNRSQNGVDVSENSDGSVLASTYTDGTNEVIVIINSRGATSLPQDSSWMFSSAGYNATTWNIGDLSNWDTSKVASMMGMFSNTGRDATTWNIGDLSNWDTSQVTDMYQMFSSAGYNATTFNLDLSNWDTSQVKYMNGMFSFAGYNATTSTLNIKGFSLSPSNTTLTNYSSIFYGMKSNAQIIVESQVSKDWILGLSSNNRPSTWTTDNIIIDDTIPTNNSVSISDGTNQIRTLTLLSTGANRMCISNTSSNVNDCTNWEAYKTTKEWMLPKTVGNHTIYVFYRLGEGTPSDAVSSSTSVSNLNTEYIHEIFDNNEYDSNLTITPGATYPWTAKNNRFESTNSGIAGTSSSTISFTPTRSGTLSFDYGVSSYRTSNGNLLITLTGSDSSNVTVASNIYGIRNLNYTTNVTLGVTYTLTLSYIKESAGNGGIYSDKAYIDNIIVE